MMNEISKNNFRKKADLKAVPEFSEDQENSLFKPDEELLQSTARIKSQRDLLAERISKMEISRAKVSKNVYEKVRRDYLMQLESIKNLLREKKILLHKELKKLYMLREKETVEINRHKEILEEARFRHILEEFSEEQFKEVEDYETREIGSLQAEFSKINSYIKVHEELFDPEDLGLQPKETPSPSFATEPTKTVAISHEEKTPDLTPKPEPVAQAVAEPVLAQPAEQIPQTPEIRPEPQPKEIDFATDSKIKINPEPQPLSNYFDNPAMNNEVVEKDLPAPPPPQIIDEIEKTPPVTYAEQKKDFEPQTLPPPAVSKTDESIFDVLEDIPLSNEAANKASPASNIIDGAQSISEVQTLPGSSTIEADIISIPPTQSYKLVFLEGENNMDIPEMAMKDNISIGRSPTNDIALKASKVSRQHAAINKYKDRYIIIDLKSSNGVFVNGRKIEEHTLEEGDEISIGGYRMVFKKA